MEITKVAWDVNLRIRYSKCGVDVARRERPIPQTMENLGPCIKREDTILSF